MSIPIEVATGWIDSLRTGWKNPLPHWILITVLPFFLGASVRTPNFIVEAKSRDFAHEVGEVAESHRRRLAIQWFGAEQPRWTAPCVVVIDQDWGTSGGETSFVFQQGKASDWRMTVRGERLAIMNAVLPHEVLHTVIATHFGRPLPRWLDEGICVSAEDSQSQAELRQTLQQAFQQRRWLAVDRMFQSKNYPSNALTFYAQGHSLTSFLLQSGGRPKLVDFITDGLATDAWEKAARQHYGYRTFADFERAWVAWAALKANTPSATHLSEVGYRRVPNAK